MKFKGFLDDEAHDIEVRPMPGGFVVTVDGVAREVDTAHLEGSFYSLLVGGESYDVSVYEDGRDGYIVRHGGFARRIRILNPLTMAEGAPALGPGPVAVSAVMPGRVVKILAEPGAEVKEGEPLLVLEAMKMENNIASPKQGKVVEVLVAAGQAVETGEKLAIVE